MQQSLSGHEDIAELAFLWFFDEATNTDNEDNDIDTENGANFFKAAAHLIALIVFFDEATCTERDANAGPHKKVANL